jgi:hypothetical protein
VAFSDRRSLRLALAWLVMALAERLGQRFASTGALAGAALIGLVGCLVSFQAIFLIVALLGLPLFFALARIRAVDIHFGRSCGAPGHHGIEQPPRAGYSCSNLLMLLNAGCARPCAAHPGAFGALMYVWGQGFNRAALAVAWLLTFAIGIAIYFLPIARLLDSLTE